MSLDREWLDRVDAWRDALAAAVSRPIAEVVFGGHVTDERLAGEKARALEFSSTPPGTRWGGKWQYGWFAASVEAPPQVEGEMLTIRADLGAEALVYVNGREAGAIDKKHKHIILTDRAVAGEKFDILIEAYAGHGSTPCHAGPTPPDVETVGEPPDKQRTVGSSTLCVWEEQVYQLLMDVETLYRLRNSLGAKSLRLAEIDKALKDFTLTADFELPRERMVESVVQARRILKPLLECVNGSTAPMMYCFGHGHLDTAWLWPLEESRRKAARTVSNQLALAERYPSYKFLMSQPAQYVWLEEDYPQLYARLVDAVTKGNVIADGAMWVEADTNISGGEALIRQFMYGKRFFSERFGIDSELCWLPDVFGYSGALPQIMSGCGVKYFSTSKIFWIYHGGQRFPYHEFTWEGIDGTGVLAHLHSNYNSHTDPATAIERWEGRVQHDGMKARLYPFGWGDGGGGPERDHLEYIARMSDLEGCPKMRMAHPLEMFERLEASGTDNRYVGELYFQAHRGVLTSQARTKKGNRRCEFALREAEMWSAIAGVESGFAFPADRMERLWKLLLVNQFHDILPGSSIRRVHLQAESDHAEVIAQAGRIARQAQQGLLQESDSLTVLNSLGWARRAIVELPEGAQGAMDCEGDPLCLQKGEGKKLVEVTVPPCGWTTLEMCDRSRQVSDGDHAGATASDHTLENDQLRVTLNSKGEIESVFDKEADREIAAGACNSFRMFKDVPSRFDAWDIDSMYAVQQVDLPGEARLEILAEGPLVATIRVTRMLNDSPMTQDISIRRGARRIDFSTTIDWRERHKLLKVAFPVAFHANEAIHEIQFGHIRRPNHRSRQFDADRFEVCNHKWTALAELRGGAAVINDCKYGCNVLGNQINLTVLRAPLAPDSQADRGDQQFTYGFYCWTGDFAGSGIVREAYDLNCPVSVRPGQAGTKSVLSVDASNIVIEAVKPAEDGSGDLIVRLYEAMCMRTRCALDASVPAERAEITDMLENPVDVCEISGGRIRLDFRPFEIKTIRLKLR